MVKSKDINEINSVIIAQLTVEKNKTKIPVAKIDRNYSAETGSRIPFAKLGFSNVYDYLKTVPGVEVIEVDNIHYVNFVGAENSYHIYDFVTNHHYTYPPATLRHHPGKPGAPSNSHEYLKKSNKEILENILSILKKYPNGLTKANLLKQLNLKYRLSENHYNLRNHLKALHKLIIIKDGLVYDNTKKDTEFSANYPAYSCKELCPDDVVTSTIIVSDTIGQILVSDLKINNNDKNGTPLIEVEVVEVYSPSFFWIHLLKNQKQFNNMMTTLGEFYQVNYEDYQVPIIMLEQGLHIACVFAGKWHRAIIKSIDDNHKVTVMFYDFGTVEKYSSNEVFYLHRSFKTLPAQAVPCGLYGVAPYNGDEWPKRVRDFFSKWVWEKHLYANVVEVNVERNSMSVILADTSGDDDFFMNDWLITNKMAKVKKMDCVDPEDMSLYVDDFCEYYADDDGEIEAIIPTTRHPESNVAIDKSAKIVSSLNKRLELYKYDWKALKSQVQKKIDEHIILTMRLYHDFMINDVESIAHEIIQHFVGESLTDSMMEVIFSLLGLDFQAIFTDITNTSAVSNKLNAEQNIYSNTVRSEEFSFAFEPTEIKNSVLSDKTVSHSSGTNNNSSKGLLSFVDISKSVSIEIENVRKQNKLETSIKEVARKYFENRNIIDLENMGENENLRAESFLDTNPFKRDLFMGDTSKKNTTEPPPLPPRPFNFKPKS